MSRYPRFKRHRSLWRPTWPDVGCVVTAEDGTWGFGTGRYGRPSSAIINDHLAPLLVGESVPRHREALGHDERASPRPTAPAGSRATPSAPSTSRCGTSRARCSTGRSTSCSAARRATQQFCYATGNDTDWYMELGFKATKLACPYGAADGLEALERNEELVARARETVGPQRRADARLLDGVRRRVRRPDGRAAAALPPEVDRGLPDPRGHRRLRRGAPPPALADARDRRALVHAARVLARGGKAPRRHLPARHQLVGGFTGLLKIARIAEAAGIAVIPHAGMNNPFGQHFVFAMPNCPWGEFLPQGAPGMPLDARRDHARAWRVPKDGILVPSDAPGFGIDITWAGSNEQAA